MTKKALKVISSQIEEKAKVGMILTLGDKVLKCVNVMETDRGTRYIFDNGIGWTKSNIESNIVLADNKGIVWNIA